MFGETCGINIGKVGSFGFAPARFQIIAKGTLRPMFAKKPRSQIFQIAKRDAPKPGVIACLGTFAPDIDKDLGLTALGHALYPDGRSDKHQNEIHPKRPDHPVGQVIFDPDPEQCLRIKNGKTERPVGQDRCRKQFPLHKGRQQQGISPKHKPGHKAKPHPGPVDVFKIDGRQNRRTELRHGGKGQHPDIGQRIFFRQEPIEPVCQKQQQDHGRTPDFQQHLADITGHAVLQFFRPQQKRHDQIVTHHGRNRDARYDHHAGTGRQPADKGNNRQPVLPAQKRQGQNECIGIDLWLVPEHEQAGNGNRHDKDIDRHQIGRKQPARTSEIAAVIIFNKGHMELARQTEHRKGGKQRRNKEMRCQPGIGPEKLPDGGIGQGALVDIGDTVKHAVHDKEPDQQKSSQLDQAFERHRKNKPVMMFGGMDIAHTKQDGENRHQDGDIKGRILGKMTGRMTHHLFAKFPDQHIKRQRHGFELKRDIGKNPHHRDQRHKGGQTLAFAIARPQKIGDRGDVLLMADPGDFGHDAKTDNHHNDRADIDRQKGPAACCRRPDRSKECPAGAIDRHRQGIDRWFQL